MNQALSVVLVHRNDNERNQLRAALEALTGVQIVGERTDLRAGMALARQVRPSILVLELAPPLGDALHAASQFRLESPDSSIFFYTDMLDSDTLLQAVRAGASDILRRPLDRAQISQAIERVSQIEARRQGSGSQHKVFTVFSSKGGSGVTTIATNLALAMRRLSGKQVALGDFDHQSGDVAFLLNLHPKRSLGDIANGPRIDSAAVQDALARHESGVDVLPQPDQLDRVDGITSDQIGQVLDILTKTHEIVVLDAPHLFNEVSLEVFDRSSTILLVTEQSVPSVRAALRSLEIFSRLNFLATPDRVRLVVNRRSDSSAIDLPELESKLGLPVFGTIANDYAAVSGAINAGKPLCLGSPEGRAGHDIESLARKLVQVESTNGSAGEQAAPARRSSRLRLFGRG